MINFLLLPILIPLITGVLLMFINKHVMLQRWVASISAFVTVIIAAMLAHKVHTEGIQTLNLSNWDAPFGITLVSDMLSALLVLTTSIISFACIIFSFRGIGQEREKFNYYASMSFLIVGVNGAFTTGDIFNLFVFFEVMLMSSYVLIVLGGTKIQLRESIKYLLVNVISSALFVIAVGYLYSVTGTLNMAHLSERIASISADGQLGIITVIGVLFMIVFGLKGAVFPLFFWLPGSYYAPPAPVMAIFGALLTKVGVYSITRTYSLLFYHEGGTIQALLGVMAVLSIIFGVIGAIAYWDIKKIIIYNIITAVGVILAGVASMNEDALAGSVFYIIHDMIVKAALFLLVGIMIAITGTSNLKQISGLIKNYPGLAWTFFIASLALAGIPPLSGFVGKLLLIKGVFDAEHYWTGAIILMSSLFVLFSVMKIFINGFWGKPLTYKGEEKAPVRQLMAAPVILVILAVVYGVGADFVFPYISQAANILVNPDLYIDAVLKE
ncbi:Na+/H+ antiporter subunit D [Bacillus mesophilum]|uniref:Na+/H+ antiporter subunit D n=1 Tax=Bacillus mesophilum TaxID=1071718 RepID=A0A7V7UVX1_9BACI|nr:Na+/H+ antiporter subunit D [Bacillus mesophilum]KAB2332975.1 Na+/H+ antiporter subunit D [Bacillus mesophilum]